MSNKNATRCQTGGGQRRQYGFSLLEVLVAIIILSVGLLGLASLQINVTKTNQSSYQRTQATMLGYLMFDAMRANRAENYDTGSDMTCTTPAAGAGRRANDLNLWFTSLKQQLGDIDTTCARITCMDGNLCTVSIQWDDQRAMEGNSEQTFSFTSRL